jgi:hypothetical protein
MARRYRPVETPLGVAKGRDAIFLDAIKLTQGTSRLRLDGELNTGLCSAGEDSSAGFAPYRITFSGVLALKIIELDSWDGESESSFDEIISSDWIRELGGKVTAGHRHYLVQTYDDVIEVVCEEYSVVLTNKNTEQGVADQRSAAVKSKPK